MAVIQICDLCKQQSKALPGRLIVRLQEGDADNTVGDVCNVCYRDLVTTLNGDRALPPKNDIEQKESLIDERNGASPEAKPLVAKGQTWGYAIKSRFDPEKAKEFEPKGCRHPFKRMDDNERFVCANAPENLKGGELAGFKGCGKILDKSDL